MTAVARRSDIDRIPPHNLQAEMAVLGSILVDKELFDVVEEIVRPSDFYAHVHESIYGALLDLYHRDMAAPIDRIVLTEELRTRGQLERVGGPSYLSALMDTVQTAGSARYYATIVHEKAVLRSLIHAGTQVTALGYEGEQDVKAALSEAQQLVLGIDEHDADLSVQHVRDLACELFNLLTGPPIYGISTGLRYVDELLGGLRPGYVYTLAARPGMGKTSMALGWALAGARYAQRFNRGVVSYYSLEMPGIDIMGSLASMDSGVDRRLFRDGGLTGADKDRVSQALSAVASAPLQVYTGVSLISQIRARSRRDCRHHGLALIAIDYAQLLYSDSRRMWTNRNEELSDVSRQIKLMALELGVPVVLLSQLNRGIETRAQKRPTLSDLRDTGAWEQDSDVVAFIDRPVCYDSSRHPYEAQLQIAKHRLGKLADLDLEFIGECVAFRDP